MTDDPTLGQQRAMIYRRNRTLMDGCLGCRRSETYCAAVREMDSQPCCHTCNHHQ